jgi:hypothetical protein
MRGQKVSLHTSLSEILRNSDLTNRSFDENEKQEEEIEKMLLEKAKRKPYEESKKRFRASRGYSEKEFDSIIKKNKMGHVYSSHKEVAEKDPAPLGIPIGDYIYYGPGPRRDYVPNPFIVYPKEKEEEKEEKYKIVRTKVKPYKDKTLCSSIFKILSKVKDPLHVSAIIEALQKADSINSETHHSYAIVYRTLTRNHAIFTRVSRATFKLRKGFIPHNKPAPIARQEDENDAEDSASLQSLVIDAFRNLPPDNQSSPADVFQLLKDMGFNRPYKSIYEAMQSASFSRDNAVYSLVK